MINRKKTVVSLLAATAVATFVTAGAGFDAVVASPEGSQNMRKSQDQLLLADRGGDDDEGGWAFWRKSRHHEEGRHGDHDKDYGYNERRHGHDDDDDDDDDYRPGRGNGAMMAPADMTPPDNGLILKGSKPSASVN